MSKIIIILLFIPFYYHLIIPSSGRTKILLNEEKLFYCYLLHLITCH
jgi:hypothetical protein